MISTASPLLDVIFLVSIKIMSTQTDIVCQPNISRFYRMLSKIFFLHIWCLYNLQNLYILKKLLFSLLFQYTCFYNRILTMFKSHLPHWWTCSLTLTKLSTSHPSSPPSWIGSYWFCCKLYSKYYFLSFLFFWTWSLKNIAP